jgi:hypothetical protein
MKSPESDAGIAQGQGHRLVRRARMLWEQWKQVARKIGDFQARALMTLFYFLILGPVAMVLCWRSDPLAIKPGTPRGWCDSDVKEGEPMERARRQS